MPMSVSDMPPPGQLRLSWFRCIRFLDDCLELFDEHGRFMLDRFPEQIQSDGVVPVNQSVARADDLWSGSMSVALLNITRNTIGGLTQ